MDRAFVCLQAICKSGTVITNLRLRTPSDLLEVFPQKEIIKTVGAEDKVISIQSWRMTGY
jgi:hypothetical protein